MKLIRVQVIDRKTKKVVKDFEPKSEGIADRLVAGLSINLNHADYEVTTRVVRAKRVRR